jgi:predicted dehydrogenase
VNAAGTLGSTGVDELSAAVLHHPAGQVGVVKSSIQVNLTCTARIAGTDGTIDLPAFLHCPTYLAVQGPGGRERIDTTHEGDGIRFQVHEVHRCLVAGKTESPVMPLDETLSIAATLDAIRGDVGVVYPGEHVR